MDAKGDVSAATNEERDVCFINGHAIRRLVKRNGVDLSAVEQEREEARVRADIERFRTGPAGTPPRAGLAVIDSILRTAKFSEPRRISFHGRDTLALDFSPGPRPRLRIGAKG